MKDSSLLSQAHSLIQTFKGKKQLLDDRISSSIHLAALMMEEAQRIQTPNEKSQQAQLAGMMNDPIGKTFTTQLTDQCFRSQRNSRIADQLVYVINDLGVPSYLPATKRFALETFSKLGKLFYPIFVPLTIKMIQNETSNVILPGEEKALSQHMQKRRKEGVRINLNHLGEAILGEEEAAKRLNIYLKDLEKPEVEYISIKISTIYSQINLLSWEDSLNILADRLRLLYRTAMKNEYIRPDGTVVQKFVNLDMEEYRDLRLTVALFKKVLDEHEFHHYKAGIVLQSYLPDSFLIQQELTLWAMQRVHKGGAPIKIRIVKGANLAMEQFEAAVRLWPQAPYTSKKDVDANYKRMVTYGCQKDHAQAANLGVASHNLFDIAYALLLRAENEVEQDVCFEMLEGMADHMRRVVQNLSGDMLLYCPAATKEEFQNAVAYLVRRLDENTAPENFLRQAFDLKPNSPEWDNQARIFSESCYATDRTSFLPRRTQNRLNEKGTSFSTCRFQCEPDTDWSLPQNGRWAEIILREWKSKAHTPIPIVINGEEISSDRELGVGEDPSYPGLMLYQYTLASLEQVDRAVSTAKATEEEWAKTAIDKRMELLSNIAKEIRLNRADLIGATVADTGKTVMEADVEISEAIDFAEYYRLNLNEWNHLPDIHFTSKGTVLVAPPWNFPCSISAGGILAALATGNCVIYKPPAESVLVGWTLVQLFWKAGVSKKVLQFITCEDDPVGSALVKDSRISTIVLTGATETAKLFLKMRPGLDLIAETGGKNAMVITGLSDRDLAIKDLIHSAFGHSGQKCSACSLAILEAEVYDDPHFRQQLKDAAGSLTVGSPWDLKSKVTPLIREPNPTLHKGLTSLEKDEEWLLQPKQHPDNPNLWSPGIKLGVKPENFTFQNELFGPVLSIVRADTVEHAFELMNQTDYGLTAGIHSLDEREQEAWFKKVEAGNCYINRTITGAIVERQPFGGCKNSSFGKNAKAGGPNYLTQLMNAEQIQLPSEITQPNSQVMQFSQSVKKVNSQFDEKLWEASLGSYAFFWKEYFSHKHDPSLVMGQDNFQLYVPHRKIVLRGQNKDTFFDIARFIAAAITCGTELEVSVENQQIASDLKKLTLTPFIHIICESEDEFIKRVETGSIKRIRLFNQPNKKLQNAFALAACNLHIGPVLANGRLELLNLLREVSLSIDYHRYGNLGMREHEKRTSLPLAEPPFMTTCQTCDCDE
ncbi:MAG: bifunctional proline dehydrogenase/L-glutamate gamma-semialdehyde dehydrogenase [Parachlamydiaceae bacterium]|nr:bifunctional proline dehydrogenase/L-glutamate gamma-semialdehyde dehydrogenase [Parachlamydiaceae bacterium]